MALAYNLGTAASRDAMHTIAAKAKGTDWWRSVPTDFPGLTRAANGYGFATKVLTTWDDVFAWLDAGQPVLLFVWNGVLQPRQYPQAPGWDAAHFVLLTGYSGASPDATDFAVNDPLVYPNEAPTTYTGASVREAAARVARADGGGGVYALVLDAPAPFTIPTPIGPIAVDKLTDDQLAAVAAKLWGSVPFNPDFAIPKAYVTELRAGTFRGVPVGGEIAVADGLTLQRFKKGSAPVIAVYAAGVGAAFAE